MTNKELDDLEALLDDIESNAAIHEAAYIEEVCSAAQDAIAELRKKNAALKGALISGLRYSAGVTKIFSERFPDEELEGTDVQKYYDEFLPLAQEALKENTQ